MTIKNAVLSKKYHDYLVNKIGLCPLSIQNKISQLPFGEDRTKIYEVIQCFIDLIFNEQNLACLEQVESINRYFCENFNNKAVPSYLVMDAIRHACISFILGGIENVYIQQENENWYPEVLLNKLPSNIDELLNHKNVVQNSNVLTIYRGCNYSEYLTGNFRRAWTTDKDIAEEFAFIHFDTSMANIETERVVLKATYSKDHIIHIPRDSSEDEVVIDPKKFFTFPEVVQKTLIP